jgi:hypothetical protein
MSGSKNKNKLRFLKLLVIVVLLVGFFVFTDPSQLSAHFLIVPFVSIFAIFYLLSIIFVELLLSSYKRRKQVFLAVMISSAPTGLLLLQSISQLSLRDFILTLLFLALFGFYVLKQDLI